MDRLILRSAERTPLPEALRRLTSLVSPLTGIVPYTTPMLRSVGDAALFHVAATTVSADPGVLGANGQYSGGIAPTLEGATAAAVGEGAERYAAMLVDEARVRYGSADQIGAAAARPESFALFHERQYATPNFPFEPFTGASRIRWSDAFRLPGGEPAYVPTQLAYLSGALNGETSIGYATSTGMACGTALEEAILSGLLELVERDAFRIMWDNALSLPVVDWSGDAVLVQDHERYYASTGLEYRVIDLSGILRVPTALTVLRDTHGEAAMVVGAAAAPHMREAIRKALREAFQTKIFARQLMADNPGWTCDALDEIATFEDHVLYYTDPVRAQHAAFLDASPRRVPVADIVPLEGTTIVERIHAILHRLHAVGAEAYAVETTPQDLCDAGLRTVTVVAPALCRLDVAHVARFLGGERLYRGAFDAGLAPAPIGIDDLNPFPHPFP